jgi:hypothetical protein
VRVAADIETDGLLNTVTTITSLCWVDLDTGEEVTYRPGNIVVSQRLTNLSCTTASLTTCQ